MASHRRWALSKPLSFFFFGNARVQTKPSVAVITAPSSFTWQKWLILPQPSELQPNGSREVVFFSIRHASKYSLRCN
jgi:hypothetical protein